MTRRNKSVVVEIKRGGVRDKVIPASLIAACRSVAWLVSLCDINAATMCRVFAKIRTRLA